VVSCAGSGLMVLVASVDDGPQCIAFARAR